MYSDTSRYLSMDHQNLINFPNSKLDIKYWKDILNIGDIVNSLSSNLKLEKFN